jgi:hypothetical protein
MAAFEIRLLNDKIGLRTLTLRDEFSLKSLRMMSLIVM